MPEYLSPGVYVEEVSFRAKSMEGVSDQHHRLRRHDGVRTGAVPRRAEDLGAAADHQLSPSSSGSTAACNCIDPGGTLRLPYLRTPRAPSS